MVSQNNSESLISQNRLEFYLSNDGAAFALFSQNSGGVTSYYDCMNLLLEGSQQQVMQIVDEGLILPVGTYQDDGFSLRVVVGELNAQEEAQWTARIGGKLCIPYGRLILCGGFDIELPESDLPVAQYAGQYDICQVEVPAGDYQAFIYSYPPHDLSGSWLKIIGPAQGKTYLGISPVAESLATYFERTRPGEVPPSWIAYELGLLDYEQYSQDVTTPGYINFVLQLIPRQQEFDCSKLDETGCLVWEDRKPQQCPVGIKMITPLL
ncbi:MAG: hypothetical protein KME08_18415 [Aphanothece sp. CMT-3BRIN-NPC111]|jgi:hypothetical protein|nr:hypothetical protein [Aphanothece sp. CMT-3BRIN-NPC111]